MLASLATRARRTPNRPNRAAMSSNETLQIRSLQAGDSAALLHFELANRAWFERHIQPRDPAVYAPAGMDAHIAEFLAELAAGTLHPCVLLDGDGAIVGRANLKDIDRATGGAEIGYRVGQQQAGRGLASRAVAHLRTLATELGLNHIDAIASTVNPASVRVLTRAGFKPLLFMPASETIQGRSIDCWRYRLRLR